MRDVIQQGLEVSEERVGVARVQGGKAGIELHPGCGVRQRCRQTHLEADLGRDHPVALQSIKDGKRIARERAVAELSEVDLVRRNVRHGFQRRREVLPARYLVGEQLELWSGAEHSELELHPLLSIARLAVRDAPYVLGQRAGDVGERLFGVIERQAADQVRSLDVAGRSH